jgi:hypothetical protein
MLEYQLLVAGVGHHQEVLVGYDVCKSLVGHTKERFTCVAYIEELLWLALSALRPKACAYTTGHYHTIERLVICHIVIKVL